jgi:cytochrome c
MSNVLRMAVVGLCALGLLIPLSFAHPFGDPREVSTASGQLLAGADIPDSLREVVDRKCGNCHSEIVEWPYYSRIAPVSWLVEHDVLDARAHMNLSRWESYSKADKIDRLSRLAAEARGGEMPPARYTAVHRDSRLSPAEQESLYVWARTERRRIMAEEKPGVGAQ